MKVFQINVDCGCYSTGKIASDLAKSLEKEGAESIVAYGREYKETGIKSYKIGNKFDIYYHFAMSKLFDDVGLHSCFVTKKLIKRIINYNPDIIHLHNLHGYYINYKILFEFLRKYSKPVVWTLHDCWPFTGHCAYFDYCGCNKWKNECSKCQQLKTYPSSYLKDNSKNNYYLKKKLFSSLDNLIIVTPSEWLANLVKESFLNDKIVKVIHNGIDTDIFFPCPTNIYKEKYGIKSKIILGVATPWSERKGLKDFIKLSRKLNKEYSIFLVGLSKKQIKLLPDNVYGIEKTLDVHELIELYSSADVFLNLTYEDNYPTTNIEAQACGTPVISYKTGGSIESCVESQIVEKGDIEALSKMILKDNLVIKSDLKISKMDMLKSYIELYKSINI